MLIGSLAVLFREVILPIKGAHRCGPFSIFRQVMFIWSHVIQLALRAYALFQRSKILLGLIGTLLVVAISIALWSIFAQNSETPPVGSDCLALSSQYRKSGSLGMRSFGDTLIFVLTYWKAWKIRQNQGDSPLVKLMARDGAVYWMCVQTYKDSTGPFQGSLSTLSSCVSVTMLYRMTLNLHEMAGRTQRLPVRATMTTFAANTNPAPFLAPGSFPSTYSGSPASLEPRVSEDRGQFTESQPWSSVLASIEESDVDERQKTMRAHVDDFG
ncbi:hypothetical protein DL96DRAFT_1596232 [Flagelloscypha sp. PMI_526]|nr:hypothetical protein DL96DRAFT_1596232 [Flagelloscypha sp. PMI_526]